MKKRNDALTPVVSAILALLIVTSTMASVLLWGVPYIEEVEKTTSKENADRQFISAVQAMDDLVNSNPGNKVINTLDLGKGSISIDVDEKDRTVIMYSFSDEYAFTILLPETCFLAGTKVLMADESYKNIEDVMVGEMVLSYDEKTKEILPCRVGNVFHHASEEMTPYYLIINTQLCVTPNHQFYTNGRWKVADDLQVGDLLFDREQEIAYPIYSLEKVYKREASFNLEVEDCHTFFVSIDERTDVLVHNPASSPNPVKQYSQRDSYMYLLAPNADYGSLSYMWVNYKLSQLRRMVLWFWTFDLGIPEEAYIMSADLNIYYYDETGDPSSRYHQCWELDTHFFENDVCWNRPRDGADNWHGGLDKIRTDVGVIDTIQVGNHGWKTWDVTESVQAFVHDDRNDYGWLIADETETVGLSKGAQYRSKEWSGTTYDPYLEISYTTDPECQTNEPNDVQGTSLTMNGEVVDDGREAVQYSFHYNKPTTGGGRRGGGGSSEIGDTEWTGSKGTGDSFSDSLSEMAPGKHGSYYARVRHSFHTSDVAVGEYVDFLTKPDPLTNLDADIINPGLINLSWTNGDGGVGAYIEYAIGSKPIPWDVGEGIPVNDSGEYGYVAGEKYSHIVNPDTTYYYKAWAYAEDGGFISNDTDAFPFGGSMETPERTTNKVPTVTTNGATDNISTIATLHGTLSNLHPPASDYDYCDVGFEYGLSDGYGKYVYVGNLTANLPFSANITGLIPGKEYHFRAVGEVEEYPYRFYGSDKTFTTWIDGIFVLSPGDRYKWRRGTTQKIEWAYNPLIWDHHVNITWQRDGEEGLINNDLPINMGSYNWSIDLTQPLGYLNYTIKITSNNDTGIYDTSGLFSIIELHEGIVYNETYDDPGSLGIKMIKGEIEYANVYWLDYGGELNPPALSGAVCIDLYNRDNYWFGSIWIIDSDSVAYESFSGIGDLQKITMENGGIINYRADGSYVQTSPPIFAGNDIFSIHAVQMIGLSMSAGGMSRFKIKMDADLYMNRIREQEHIYNLRLQFYGDNHEAWVTYFTSNYEFEKEPEPPSNTLFYTPSSSKLWFAFAHSSVELYLHS